MTGQAHKKPEVEETKHQAIPGHGVRIGGGVETKKGEWRCGICKFKNVTVNDDDQEIERCNMCKEPKKIMKEVNLPKTGNTQ